jgi:restriction system protein
MAVPDFQSMMLPVLTAIGDHKPHHLREVAETVAKAMGISDEDRLQRMPKWNVTIWSNRIAWVGTHFKFAGLITRPARGQIQITERGLQVLQSKPKQIDARFLRQFPEYDQTRKTETDSESQSANNAVEEQESPLETVEKSMAELRQALAAELLETIKSRPPEFFEQLVLDLVQKLGYGSFIGDAAEHLGRGGDRGLDGAIKEDKLGLDIIYLQAKRWKTAVGPDIVREFLGALDQAGAKKGVLITTSTFTKEARLPFSKSDKKISLIDGAMLVELMIDHDLGVTPVKTYQIKKIDSDYFEED